MSPRPSSLSRIGYLPFSTGEVITWTAGPSAAVVTTDDDDRRRTTDDGPKTWTEGRRALAIRLFAIR